jgi:hypothetical protein
MEENVVTGNYKRNFFFEGKAVTGNQTCLPGKKFFAQETVTGNRPDEDRPSPGYYAVIPATVLFDASLPHGARLLYGLISSLSRKTGFCWASNLYLSELYGNDERTISNWIARLQKAGHVYAHFKYFPGSKKIQKRLIFLTCAVTRPPGEGFLPPPPEIDGEENPAAGPEQTGAGGEKIFNTNGEKPGTAKPNNNEGKTGVSGEKIFNTNAGKPGNFGVVVKKFSTPGGEKNFREIYRDLDLAAAAAASKNKPETGPPPDAVKKAFLDADPLLIFKAEIYQKAAAYLAEHDLDLSYAAWVFKQARGKKPDSLPAMFLTLFFAEDVTGRFKAASRPPPEPIPVFLTCPVCATRHDREACPECGLKNGADGEAVRYAKRLYALPPEKRAEYGERAEQIFFASKGDFKKAQSLMAGLHREFNLTGLT